MDPRRGPSGTHRSGSAGGPGRLDGVAKSTQVLDERHWVTRIHIGTQLHEPVGHGPVGHCKGAPASVAEVVNDPAAVIRIAVAFDESAVAQSIHQGGNRRSADR